MRLYIRVESAARELDAKLHLAATAASAGFDVVIGEVSQELLLKWNAPPGIFHDHNATPLPRSISMRSELLERGFLITMQDDEHGMTLENFDQHAQVRYSRDSFNQIAKIFAWGPWEAEGLRKTFGDSGARVVVTGSPRVDLWRMGQAEDPLEANGSTMGGRATLIATNLFVLSRGTPPREVFEHTRGVYPPGQFASMRQDFIDFMERDIFEVRETVAICEFLASARLPSLPVIRPHPTEDPEFWKGLTQNFPDVTVAAEGAIAPLVRDAGAVVHFGSTVAIEARLSTRRVLTMISPSVKLGYAFSQMGIVVANAAEAIAQLESNPTEYRVPWSRAEDLFIRERIANPLITDPLAAARIVVEWQELAADAKGGVNRSGADGHRRRQESQFLRRARIHSSVRSPLVEALARRSKRAKWEHQRLLSRQFPTIDSLTAMGVVGRSPGRELRQRPVIVESLGSRLLRVRARVTDE